MAKKWFGILRDRKHGGRPQSCEMKEKVGCLWMITKFPASLRGVPFATEPPASL